jgi:hypothetical protein
MEKVDPFLHAFMGDIFSVDLDGDVDDPRQSARPHPVEQLLTKAANERSRRSNNSVADPAWTEEIGVIEKRDRLPGSGTLAKRLGIVRTEFHAIDDERWVYAFDKNDQLVDVRVLLPEIECS